MSAKEGDYSSVDWEKLPWEKTPSYDGVFVCLFDQEFDPDNPVPKFTVMAVKVEPGKSIPLHRHNREPGWEERIDFPQGGEFEIQRKGSSETISGNEPVAFVIRTGEPFGLTNISPKPLYFLSSMKPGFTGYGEIEQVKAD